MSGCVAYWVQVLLSNSLLDLTTFGAVGVTEDAAMVLVVGEFCALTFTVVFATFAFLNLGRFAILDQEEQVDKMKFLVKGLILALLMVSTFVSETYEKIVPNMSGMKLMGNYNDFLFKIICFS